MSRGGSPSRDEYHETDGSIYGSHPYYNQRQHGYGSDEDELNHIYNATVDPRESTAKLQYSNQDGYDSCGTCAESQKAYCPRRVGNGQFRSIDDNDSCGTCAESQKAYCPRRVGKGQSGSIADDDSCGTCAESQKAYCPRRLGKGQSGSIGDNDSCGTCAESHKAYCTRKGGYDSCGSMADEPNQDYNPSEDGYNSGGSIDESHNAYDQPEYEDRVEADYLNYDDEEGYSPPPRQPRVQPVNPLISENKELKAMIRSLTSKVDALIALQKSLTSENFALRVAIKSVTSENDALKCLNKESKESAKEENTRTLFERVRQSVGL
ncbi:uncharacterized protein LOC141655969 [Silene latifolia]|uniref:uncharacterized protein LOC141655969 n=1 Tax=Silene latifolia TaxID=37657 RepID=UPI003D77A420